MIINGGNYYHEKAFFEVCKALEQGNTVDMYIDCIGHTRNNMEQEAYKESLLEKYGDKLIVECAKGVSYSYSYKLRG